MNLKAESLRAKSGRHLLIQNNVSAILLTIEQDIREASENGKTSCSIKIPVHFPIPSMSNSDAQLHIYTKVIIELEERGFSVTIDRENNIWTISGWDIDLNADMKRKMLEYIGSRCKN